MFVYLVVVLVFKIVGLGDNCLVGGFDFYVFLFFREILIEKMLGGVVIELI